MAKTITDIGIKRLATTSSSVLASDPFLEATMLMKVKRWPPRREKSREWMKAKGNEGWLRHRMKAQALTAQARLVGDMSERGRRGRG